MDNSRKPFSIRQLRDGWEQLSANQGEANSDTRQRAALYLSRLRRTLPTLSITESPGLLGADVCVHCYQVAQASEQAQLNGSPTRGR
jgi:hypothetical protein